MNRLIAWIALVLAGVTPAAADAQNPAKTFGLFIGIDAYPRSPLPNCVNDAKDMAAVMAARGVPGGNMRILLDREASRKGILEALEWLVRATGSEGAAQVYFSGHGGRTRDRSGDEADGVDETWVAADLREVLDDEIELALIPLKGRVLVVSDSCHSGTVTKELAIGKDDLTATLVRDGRPEVVKISGGKFFDPALLAQARKDIGVEDEGDGQPVARDVLVAGADRLRRNAAGGSISREHGLEVPDQIGLFASCADLEVSNATRGRNSAFTLHFLQGIRESQAAITYGWMRQFTDARLRTGGYRSPQHPSLFGVTPEQSLPWFYQSAQVAPAAAAPAGAATMGDAARRLVGDIVFGIFRREDSAPAQAQDWIASLATQGGKQEFADGDPLALEVLVSAKAPAKTWLVIVNVGPSGNMTLLYPNFHDRGGPLAPGSKVAIGAPPSRAELRLFGAKGQESIVAYALEWDPFTGFDWAKVGDSNHVFLETNTKDLGGPLATQEERHQAQNSMVRARDVGVSAAPTARPGEGFSRQVLRLQHR